MANNPVNSKAGTWILIVLVLLLSGATLANLYLLLNSRDGDAGNDTAESTAPPPPPEFFAIGPMTVNLQSDNFGNRLLYVGLSLRIGQDGTRELLEIHRPEVHSRLLVLLSSQKAEDLTSPGGKEQLAQEIVAMLTEEPLESHLPPLSVRSVLFTDFIVQ